MPILSSIIDRITSKYKIYNQNKIAVGISGGSDSTALTFLLNEWANKNNKELIAITIDHDLRTNSDREALEVQAQLNKNKIKHIILKWQHTKVSSNIQAKARQARYQLLTDFCIQQNISCLFIAHVKEDVAENFLIRLQRGSGLDGLSAIQELQVLNKVNIIRPLLHISKEELKSFLIEKNINWIDDPSNYNDTFTRVRIRNELSNNHQYIDRICLASNHLRMVKNFVDKITNQYFNEIVRITSFGVAIINKNLLFQCDDYIITTILSRVLQIISCSDYKARYVNLENLIIKIREPNFQNASLMNCNIIYKKSLGLIISNSLSKNTNEKIEMYNFMWKDRFKIEIPNHFNIKEMYITSLDKYIWQNLDKKIIIYTEETKSLPKLSLFSMPVIKNLEKIVAIPYLNYYTEDIYKEIKINYMNAENICNNNLGHD